MTHRLTRIGVIALILVAFTLTPTVAQDTFQLAPPYLRYSSVFFEKSATVTMEFAQPGTVIHYTTNGAIPTPKDPVYTKPLHLKKNFKTLKAKVFGVGFLPSEVVEATFFKTGIHIKNITTTLPHERYPGAGKRTLIDGEGGITAYNSKTWMGFQTDTVTILLTLARPQKVKHVLLHVLQNQGAWIFSPQKVEVYAAKNGKSGWELWSQKKIESTEKAEKPLCRPIFIDLENQPKTTQIMLRIYPLMNLPEWHPGKGAPAWLFMDEINLY